ncbi:MAG TPA: 2-amino-4-hydroxy-6-hydroxymethyldihydropteridine diphosphokinase [Burkholderiales bacterium]|nr:2-amino-4-hydroxy-6-hydroxymethyldihydropteridine diphosphokinase [Burkholderiales bacterium]
MTLAYVGIGSNLEDPESQVRRAFDELANIRDTRLKGKSSLYRSAPLGHADQPDFINAVAALETDLSADELFGELKGIEERHGRKRSFANAPRTLDLDLLLYGDERIATAALTVPHPRMHERAFVLRPLLEVSLDFEAYKPFLEACAGQKIERIG